MRTRAKYGDNTFGNTLHEVRNASREDVNHPWGPFGDPVALGNPNSIYVLEESEDIIIDDTTPTRVVKTVTHTKRKFHRSIITTADEYTNTQRYTTIGNNVHIYSWGDYGRLAFADLSVSYPKTVSQLKTEALHKFMSDNEVNNLLNLIESPQIPASLSSIINLMKSGSSGGSLKKFFKNSSKAVSGGFLAWSFGIAPLLSDINKINRAITTLKRDIDNAVKHPRARQRVSAVSYGTISPNISASGYSSNQNNDDGSWWHVGIHPSVLPIRRVGISGRRNVEFDSDAMKRLDYVIRRFVSTGPISLGWELIPFSFVVDWFVNLSGIIDAMDAALTGGSKTVDSAWMSEKYSVLVPVLKHKYNNWTSDSDGKQVALNELMYYHREPISSNVEVGLSGRFGKKQLSLTAALIHQQVANLKRFR